ncbi:MAG: NAD-dependent epimerase/dehydratase family protein [Thermoplasmata archaeon]
MAKYLVTGGAGFIGSNLAHKLIESGHEVTVVDSLHTGSKNLISDINVEFYHLRVDEYFHERKWKDFDGIFHLGKPSSTPIYKENREKISESVNGTIAVLEMSKEMDAKLVTASSSSLYNGLEPPHNESMIIKPTDFYTEARLVEERLAKVYEDFYGIRWNAMRFFSVYGPGEQFKKNFANLISQFIWALNKNERPVIYGDGNQRRDFIYIDDVVNALMLAMKSNQNGIFNVGTGKSYSLNDVISILKNKTDRDIKPKYIDNPVKNYVSITLADTNKSKKYLGFEAKVSIEKGIEKAINYYNTLNI